MSQYRLIFTNIGLSKKQNAELNNDYIQITQFAVGSGVIANLNPSLTALLIEEYRANINNVDTKDGVTVFDLVIPSDVGGFYIKEVALFDVDGDCICIGTVPITYKVNQDEGASKAIHLKVSTTSTNTENIVFNTDDSLVYATVSYVNNSVNALKNEMLLELPKKVNVLDVKNGLFFSDTDKPLSAAMGKLLKQYIDNINTLLLSDNSAIDNLQEIVDFIELHQATLDTLGIANIAGLQNALNAKLGVNSNAVSATKLFTPRLVGGVSFDGTSNINLPGVNIVGNQDTSGSAALLNGINSSSFARKDNGAQSFGGSIEAINSIAINSNGSYRTLELKVNGVRKGYISYDSINNQVVIVNEASGASVFLKSDGNIEFGSNLKADNGYTKLNNGIILQWGCSNVTAGGVSVGFPISFPNKVFVVTNGAEYPNNPSDTYVSINWKNKNGFGAIISNSGTLTYNWIAIGY